MGPFDLFRKKGSKPIQAPPLKVRKQVVTSHVSAAAKSSPLASSSSLGLSRNQQNGKNTSAAKPQATRPRQQQSKKRPSPAHTPFESDSSDVGDTADEAEARRKRPKLSAEPELDKQREIRSREAFSAKEDKESTMVHAADIAALGKPTEYKSAFPDCQSTSVSLQYPSAGQAEKYELVQPVHYDDFNPLDEIREVIMVVADHYLPSSAQATITDENNGFLRRLKLATTKHAGDDYIGIVQEWNVLANRFRTENIFAQSIDAWKYVDLDLIERILTQTYARTVSPRIKSLRQYENGTDNVYGELLPKFVSDILRRDTKLTSDQVFVDLGSGVGNVVLQAALQIGCESWGCEMMENTCDLAALQQKEFAARCRLWGLAIGSIHLERGDFLENQEIGKVLKRADVILVNNQAFTPELNEGLTSLFLDAKEGCKIVSLKSFVPSGHKITSRNLYRACNVLNVIEKRYYSACVSWTDAPGTYYVSVKDSSKVAAFAEKHA